MNYLVRAYGFLRAAAENLLALILVSLFVSFLIQIVFRYLLNLPVGWTVEYVTIAWLWGILFGYAFVVRDEEIIRFDIFYAAGSRNVRRAMDIIAGLTCAAIFIGTLPAVWNYVSFMAIERTAFMRIRFDYVFMIYIPFMLSVIIRCLINVWQGIKGTHSKYTTRPGIEGHDYD